jgi:hypothetical protein
MGYGYGEENGYGHGEEMGYGPEKDHGYGPEMSYGYGPEKGHGYGEEMGYGYGEEMGYGPEKDHGYGPEMSYGYGPETGHGYGEEMGYGYGEENGYGYGEENGYGYGEENGYGEEADAPGYRYGIYYDEDEFHKTIYPRNDYWTKSYMPEPGHGPVQMRGMSRAGGEMAYDGAGHEGKPLGYAEAVCVNAPHPTPDKKGMGGAWWLCEDD